MRSGRRRRNRGKTSGDVGDGAGPCSWTMERTMTTTSETRPPLPPFTRETALKKVRAAEDGWNSRDPEKVSLAYTEDSWWRNRAEFFQGRAAIVAFLTRKWARELDYRLIKEL